MSGCRLSSAVREARIAFGNDLTGMGPEGGRGCGESVMRPREALCGCCENTSVGRKTSFLPSSSLIRNY